MTNELRVTLEIGLKGKKVAVVAPDWPGLERGAKTPEAALERLEAYIPRYAPIAKLAGMEEAFAKITTLNLIETYTGTGSTDFWGISYAFSSIDKEEVSGEALERELTLMRACWTFFDFVRFRVSEKMQKGPRGGGRDRDHIVRHTLAAEMDWAGGLGLPNLYSHLTDEINNEVINAHRAAYCDAIRTFHAEGKMAKKWPLRYLIRHTAYHTLDHAWEMEDKDLTN